MFYLHLCVLVFLYFAPYFARGRHAALRRRPGGDGVRRPLAAGDDIHRMNNITITITITITIIIIIITTTTTILIVIVIIITITITIITGGRGAAPRGPRRRRAPPPAGCRR